MSTIYGTPGDDWFTGTADDDLIDAGAGNDYLDGGAGNDTYVFGLGSGHDTIFNSEPASNRSIERIRLNPDVRPEDVELL
jgi:Ca2+-binding RTX toxin-like protein